MRIILVGLVLVIVGFFGLFFNWEFAAKTESVAINSPQVQSDLVLLEYRLIKPRDENSPPLVEVLWGRSSDCVGKIEQYRLISFGNLNQVDKTGSWIKVGELLEVKKSSENCL